MEQLIIVNNNTPDGKGFVKTARGFNVFLLVVKSTGNVIADHACSDPKYAKGDLHDRREDRKEQWKKLFGEYEVKYLEDSDITTEELIRRNRNRRGDF